MGNLYDGVFCVQGTWLRFIEYSFSAAVMIVAISLQVGLMDAWMLFALATLTWATMMLGLVGERVLAVEKRLRRVVNDLEERDTLRSARASRHPWCPPSRWRGGRRTSPPGSPKASSFVVIIAHFFQSQGTCEFDGTGEENVAPDFVFAIVFCELWPLRAFRLDADVPVPIARLRVVRRTR